MNRSKQRKRQEEGAGPEAGVPGRAQEAGAGGKRWVGKRVRLGKGGRAAGKWTGFSRVFPDVSMQVVDFPHLGVARLFGKLQISKFKAGCGASRCAVRILVAIFVTERSLMFAYVRLKSLMFAYFEKNVFFSGVVVGIFGHTTGGGYDG